MSTRKYRRLDDWKVELIGKTFTFLYVKDVTQIVNHNGNKRYVAICECKCGNVCNIDVYGLLRCHNKSCGCYEKSEENSERHREINNKNKDVMSAARKQWCNNNKDKVKEIGNKVSAWCKDNPDKVKERIEKQKQWYKDNPDKVKERSDKYSKWCKDNPDKVKSMIANQQLWRNDSEKVAIANEKRLITFKNNPEIMANAGKKISAWRKHNVKEVLDSIKVANAANSAKASENRKHIDFSSIIDSIHPDYIESLTNGDIKGHDSILIRCPQCGNYANHKLSNVFVLSKQQVRCYNTVLCRQCHSSITASKQEDVLCEFISTFYNGECVRNSREIISPLELDLYYPEKKIAVEFNGDYWHSDEHKCDNYHYNKFIICKQHGITLVSIFEKYWKYDKCAIKDYISDLFNGLENSMSFNKDGYINNNYPPPFEFNIHCETLNDYYTVNKCKVFTCGYTKYERHKKD